MLQGKKCYSHYAATEQVDHLRLTWSERTFMPKPHMTTKTSQTPSQTTVEWLSRYTGCNYDVDLSQQCSGNDDQADLCGSVLHGQSLSQMKSQPTRKKAFLGAVRRMRTRIRLLVQPEPMRSIIGATQ